MSICKVGEVSAAGDTTDTMLSFCNINPNLPSNITVGYTQHNNETIFCLDNGGDDDTNGRMCYKDTMPGVHRALSNFNLNDYTKPERDNEAEVPLTLDDMDKLVPGMWLKCLYDINDSTYYEAMFLTTNSDQMGPNVEKITSDGNNLIGVEYHWDELGEGDDDQKWVPISWCIRDESHVIQCDISQTDDGSSKCDFMVTDTVEPLFLRAFKDITILQKQSDSCNNPLAEKVLFTYSDNGGVVGYDENGYLQIGRDDLPLPVEMETSTYDTIYSAIPFKDPAIQQLDNKFKLYQLYKDDPVASKPFPKSYSSHREALADTEHEEDSIFYIKGSASSGGDDISMKTRDELSEEYQILKKKGYDVDEGKGDVIIQRAVTDLYTIYGESPISGRRFDIRYYLLVAKGKVYLHSNFFMKWATEGKKYDPTDSNIINQVLNMKVYTSGSTALLPFIDAPRDDVNGNKWNNNEKRRKGVESDSSHKVFNPHSWRDAVCDALESTLGVFSTIMAITKNNPTEYSFIGGDAIIREDGSAVIVEFNVFPDTKFFNKYDDCLKGEKCKRMVVPTNDGSDYKVTEKSIAGIIAPTELIAEVWKDSISLIMGIQAPNEKFRELIARE